MIDIIFAILPMLNQLITVAVLSVPYLKYWEVV